MTCEYVKQYLDGFLEAGSRSTFDPERVSDHVRACSACYDQLACFFKAIELPPSTYLQETVDELCLAMYRLAGVVLRERADPEDNTENVVSVAGAADGSAHEFAEQGHEMIADVEDYTGSGAISGRDLGEVRKLLDDAERGEERKVDLAIVLCEEIARFTTRHRGSALNLLGVLSLWRNRVDAARTAFVQALAEPDSDHESRIARASAFCNLGYTQQIQGDLIGAVKSERRSLALCEELDIDPFHALFGLFYFSLLREGDGLVDARDAMTRLLALPDGPRRLSTMLGLENNQPILEALRRSPIVSDHPGIVPAPPGGGDA